MDMTKYTGKNYLTIEEVKNAEIKKVTILNKGEEINGKFGKHPQFEVQLTGSNELKTFTVFENNVKTMIAQQGVDSVNWVGKTFSIAIEQNQNGTDIIAVVEEPKKEE